jgi:hypothetical protein
MNKSKLKNRFHAIGLLVSVAIIFVARGLAPVDAAPLQISSVPPPIQLKGLYVKTNAFIEKGFQRAHISWQSGDTKALVFDWRAMAGTIPVDQAPAFPAPHPYPITRKEQIVPVQSYITAVEVLDSSRLLIAAVTSWDSSGKTLVYIQDLVWPKVMPAVYNDTQTGEQHVDVAMPTLGKKKYLYTGVNTPGKMGVRLLWKMRVGSDMNTILGSLFQFHDSGDVYSVNLNGLHLQQVAWSQGAPSGSFEEAGLLDIREGASEYLHKQAGILYVAEAGIEIPGATIPHGVTVLTDSDKDGDVDKVEVISPLAWSQMRGALGANFTWSDR